MKKLTRRAMIGQVVTLPFVAGIFSCQQNSTNPNDAVKSGRPSLPGCNDSSLAGPRNPGLNVFLHGLFFLSPQTSPTSLFAPVVPGHIYGCMYTGANGTDDHIFLPGSSYILAGIDPGTQPLAPDSQQEFIFPQAQYPLHQFQPNNSYFKSFQMPRPNAYPGRRRILKKGGQDFLLKNNVSGTDNYGMTPDSIPFVYVITYLQNQFTSATLSNAKLTEDGTMIWSFAPTNDPASYNLHLFAEVAFADPNHYKHALDAINNMFAPQPLSLAFSDPHMHNSATCDEEKDILERIYGINAPSRGGEVANCMSIILG